MGKVISVPEPVQVEVETPKGLVKHDITFFDYLLASLDEKAEVSDLKKISAALDTKRKVKAAKDAKVASFVLENEEYSLLAAASIKLISSRIPLFAMAQLPFARALEAGSVQDV